MILKVVVSLILIGILTSCKTPTTEDKIKAKLIELETEQMKAEGLTVESLTVDSISYLPNSRKDFEMERVVSIKKYALDTNWQHADTTRNLYHVKYRVAAKTNKLSVNQREGKYLNQIDLSELK